jgi:hypothetical protein
MQTLTFTERDSRALNERGYLVWPDAILPALLADLRARVADLEREEGDSAGSEFKREPGCIRLANLVDKGPMFREVITHSRVLRAVRHVLGPEIKLSSLNGRTAPPGSPGQPLHCDMGAVPDERGFWVCNSVWLLTDMTAENGALRVVPGSHRWGGTPQDLLADPHAPHPDEVPVTGSAGSIAVFNSHLWHAGMPNRSCTPRTVLHGFYCRRDKPQQQYQRRLLRPHTQAGLTPEERYLLALDDPENDRLSALPAPVSGFLK